MSLPGTQTIRFQRPTNQGKPKDLPRPTPRHEGYLQDLIRRQETQLRGYVRI